MRRRSGVLGLGFLLCLSGCGGGGSSTPSTPATPVPVTPAATIEASGSGNLEVHPSSLSGFGAALVMPIRIRETGGGKADWTYARYSATLKGVELERKEFTSDSLINAGISKITANQNLVYSLTFHINATDFDNIVVTLGFADLKDARQFSTQVPLSTFSGVVSSPTPTLRSGLINLDR
jgi:hypothetical protein